ncbi:VRR-NUC domain-containing protein [Parahaliea mediterranea]|uniref:phosphodiesterase I n=1 Tax=Parahaliea mediterranea TaxID=651086 RepID=A0A939DJ28_9GAMM|nr:VRR-NUC domain-containing protein [Parahaliea mediterranea]MBN7799071.1 VRR-NUC domain-containing protein [Parahaliea mediterranea]
MAGPAGGEAVALPPRYYRDNFLALCRTVEAQYGDLLTADERDWLAGFRALTVQAQCLYLRLVSRVGPWFRPRRLDYAEIGSLSAPLAELRAAGYLVAAEVLAVEELGRLYTRAELGGLFPRALRGLRGDKRAALAAIAQWSEAEGADLLAVARGADGEAPVAATGLDRMECLQLLFFGNRRQSLTDFILSDLGVATYHPYRLDRAHRLFPDRPSVEDYLACGRLADHYAVLREAGDDAGIVALARSLLDISVNHCASERRWWRLFNRVARQLERCGELDTALSLYRRSALHPARERAARVLEAQQDWRGAIALCREILDTPWGEEEREAARRILPRVQRRAGDTPARRPRDSFARLDLSLERAAERVELAAARALAADWAAVYYVENTLVNGLFGLAFWEEMFSPVAGAFHNPYQAVPADMYDGGFYRNRRSMLDRRLERLAEADLAAELGAAYRRYQGLQCHWVHWRALPLALVEAALARIPASHLLAMWRRMLFDPGECRRGFPDLLALGERPGEYCMIEVKGPGDALQESQKRWLRFFGEQDIPAAVAWVRWRDD